MKKVFALVECPSKYHYISDLSEKLGISCEFISSLSQLPLNEEKMLLLFESKMCKNKGIDEMQKVGMQKINHNGKLIIGMATDNESDLEKIECLYYHPQISHIFSSDPLKIENEISKVLYIFGSDEELKNNWIPELKNIKKVVLQSSEDRWACYDELHNFADGLNCFPGFSDLACTMASELLNNAFYNAPRDMETGKAKYPDRTLKVNIEPPDSVFFWYGADQEFLWLIAEDPFGTLGKTTLYKSLYRAVRDRSPDWSVEVGGAGLGLYMMFDNCSEIVFNLMRSKTRVCCKMKITKRSKLFAEEQVSLHIIERS